MDAVLPGKAVRRGCVLQKNSLGLYDLQVNDESGAIVTDVKNITFYRAVSILEENMYLSGRAEHDG